MLGMFASYIKKHKLILLAVVCTVAVFVTVFYLYRLPLEPILYATVLTVVIFAIIGAFGFASYYKKHRELLRIKHIIGTAMLDFPEAGSAVEEDYQEVIKKFSKVYADMISSSDKAYTDMLDYYTMWVHQIKTPISAMRLLLEEKQEMDLLDQLFRIEQYVEIVLHYLRSENMSGDLEIAKYSLEDIVKQAVKKYSRPFIYKKISLELHDLDIAVLTDEKWLSFVVEQVISNALKYTQNGRISIYAEAPKVLVIEDTGIGIQPEDLPRVCEKGFTGFNGRADKKSTGIGLYLCKKILTKLAHTIEIESELGVGTRVKIDLTEM